MRSHSQPRAWHQPSVFVRAAARPGVSPLSSYTVRRLENRTLRSKRGRRRSGSCTALQPLAAIIIGALLLSCATSRRAQLTPVAADLAHVQTVAVTSTESFIPVPAYIQQLVLDTLRPCHSVSIASPNQADLLITQIQDSAWVCTDAAMLDGSCDPRNLAFTLRLTNGKQARWQQRLPFWCVDHECLLKLFVGDLQHFVCTSH